MGLLWWLLDASPFHPRARCGEWSAALAFTYRLANVLIAATHLSIPITLAVLWRRRRNDLASPRVLLLFTAFLFTSGLSRMAEVLAFDWAPYRLFTLLLCCCAALGVVTALFMPAVLMGVLRLPSRKEIHDKNDQLQAQVWEIEAKNQVIDALRKAAEEKAARLLVQVERLERMRRTGLWALDADATIAEMRSDLSRD